MPAKRGQISLGLKKLLDVMGIKGKQVYSFRHSASTQQVVMGLDETLLNTSSYENMESAPHRKIN